MILKIIGVTLAIFAAFVILAVSVSRLSYPNYAFYQPSTIGSQGFTTNIEYNFPYPGIASDHPLWVIKALRDKVWLEVTPDPEKKFRLLLLFADKRVLTSFELMERGESELAVSTASRAESYLFEAFEQLGKIDTKNSDVVHLYDNLSRASLKHREVLEEEIKIAPDDAKPYLSQIVDIPKNVYDQSVDLLKSKGKTAPTPLPVQKLAK